MAGASFLGSCAGSDVGPGVRPVLWTGVPRVCIGGMYTGCIRRVCGRRTPELGKRRPSGVGTVSLCAEG